MLFFLGNPAPLSAGGRSDTLGLADSLNVGEELATGQKRGFWGTVRNGAEVILKDFSVKAGVNFGATVPPGLPEGSTVISYSPIFAPAIVLEKSFTLYRWLYILTGLRFEYKGMQTKAAVENFSTQVVIEMGGELKTIAGNFTGINFTNITCSYIALPVRVGFQITPRYSLQAGGFVAWAMTNSFKGWVAEGFLWQAPDEHGNSVRVPVEMPADYDFSREMNRLDAGVELYGSHKLTKHLLLDAGMALSLRPIFDPDEFKGMPFSMYHMYLQVALGYQFH